MAKRLTEKEKEEIIRSFIEGKNIDALSKEFNCNKLTIARNIKKSLGEKKYKDLNKKNKSINRNNYKEKYVDSNPKKESNKYTINDALTYNEQVIPHTQNQEDFHSHAFTELAPLSQEIDNSSRKDLSSIPISEIDLPKTVYMIVNEKIDLETKFLKEYPQWEFLSESEQIRKTIEIFFDLKIAKRFCKSNQKVIKVPNTEVFRIVAPILLSRGISRIICEENLLAL